jgi:hypothetical protein
MSAERPSAPRSRRLRIAVALTGVLTLVLVNGGRADAATTTTTDPVQAAAGWLATQFEDDNHLPVPAGDHFHSSFPSNGSTVYYTLYGQNADVIFGLAAAKAGGDKIATALNYLVTNADLYADFSGAQGGPFDGSIAKMAVAAQVAAVSGTTATAFGSRNLLSALKGDECTGTTPDGFGGFICVQAGAAKNIFSSVSESLAILAEARAGGPFAPSANAITYFDSLQCSNGGFTADVSACGTGAADLDATSYAIMAMSLLSGHTAQLTSAVNWLHGQQDPGGYWVSQGAPNPNSTGLAASALASQSVDVSAARTWLLSQQVAAGAEGAGAIKYAGAFAPTTTSATSTSVLATAQALDGLVSGASLATLTATGATAGTAAFAPTQTVSTSSAVQGSTQTVTASGFAAGETVEAVLHSAPVTVGSAVAGANGAVSISFAVPTSVDPGAHTLILTGATSGLSVSSALAVTAAAVTTPTTPTTPAATTADPIANTGLNGPATVRLGVLGVLSVLAGSGLLLVGRRRRA